MTTVLLVTTVVVLVTSSGPLKENFNGDRVIDQKDANPRKEGKKSRVRG